MLVKIQHKTNFNYSGRVSDTVFETRMSPRSDEDQTVLSYQLEVKPRAPVMSYRDGFGNRVDLFNIHEPYQTLHVETQSIVRTHRRSVSERLLGLRWDPAAVVTVDAMDYLSPSALVDRSVELEGLAADIELRSGGLGEVLLQLSARVRELMTYDKRATEVHTPLSEAIRKRSGVCQDFAHAFIGVCRALGLPCRYVSGYVHHPGEIATHAWCQAWAGERAGWVDIDPTSGDVVGDDHVVTAIGRDYGDVPPNRGVWRGEASEVMDVSVTVEPIDHVPPMLDEWAAGSQYRRRAGGGFGPRSREPVERASQENRPVFPVQPRPSAALYRQQGQQQQQ